MDTFWKGSFSPDIRKSIGTVTYVPLLEMTPEDWKWLEYNNIRTVARNRIDDMALEGDLLGFLRVSVYYDKKPMYLWPIDDSGLEIFIADEAIPFGHEADVDTPSEAVGVLETLRTGMFMVPASVLILTLNLVMKMTKDAKRKNQLSRRDQEFLEQFDRETVEFIVATVLMWEMSLAEAESVLDDLPESDDVDAASDWVRTQQERIEKARRESRQIAAARDLTATSEDAKIIK